MNVLRHITGPLQLHQKLIRGTTVKVKFPYNNALNKDMGENKCITFLVADDHAIVPLGISYLVDLQPNFTVVDGTASGTDTYIRVEQGGIDILIMDLSMPLAKMA